MTETQTPSGDPGRHHLAQPVDVVIDRLVPASHQPIGEHAQHGTGLQSQRGDLPDWGIGDADGRVDGDPGQAPRWPGAAIPAGNGPPMYLVNVHAESSVAGIGRLLRITLEAPPE